MKTGLAALIAAVAAIGIATVAKGKAEEEENRLRMEAQDRAHQRKIELKRIEQEEKMANAPRIPIYKPVKEKCPNCNGDRITDMEKGFIRCPYCDRVERLEIDHYKIDLEGYENKLKEEEIRRNQELDKFMKSFFFWMVIAMLAVWAFYSLSIYNGVAFLICAVIVTGMLLIRYPQLRLPAIWLYIMPIPLTKILLNDEGIKQKFNSKARGWLLVAVWILYFITIAMIVVFWNSMKNPTPETLPPPDSSTNVITETIEATTEETITHTEFGWADFTEDTIIEELNCVQYQVPISWTKMDGDSEDTRWYATSQNNIIECQFIEKDVDEKYSDTIIDTLLKGENDTDIISVQLKTMTTLNSHTVAIAEGLFIDNSNQYPLTEYILLLPQGVFAEFIIIPLGDVDVEFQDEMALISSVDYIGHTSTETTKEPVLETTTIETEHITTVTTLSETTTITTTPSPIETTTAIETKPVQETAPAASGNITPSENADFAAILKVKDYCDDSVAEFVKKYKNPKIEFDCYISNMQNHGAYSTRYDIQLMGGNYDPNNAVGAYFKFVDVNITSDLKLTGNIPDSIGEGTNLHVVAKIKEWDGTCIVLTPVSTEVR